MEKEYKTEKCVPYQLCPKCNGKGWVYPHSALTCSTEPCDVCKGAKIIPMYVLPNG